MQMLEILEYFHQYGFVVVKGLHAKEGEIINFAERIGFIRETNFGKTFDVRSKKQFSLMTAKSSIISSSLIVNLTGVTFYAF